MKEIIFVSIILIIIISGNIFINNYLKASSDSLIIDLKELNNKMNNNSKEINKFSQNAERIYNNWQETEEKWAVIVLHSELDLIEISLIKMKTEIEVNNIDLAKEELETSIFLINHIREKDKVCLKNIF